MNRKLLVKQYKLACYEDNLSSTEKTKQARLEALAELGRYSKKQIKESKEQQLSIFGNKFMYNAND